MGSLAGPVGFDAADRLGRGPADGAVVLVVELDRDGLGGDVDRDDPAGVDPAEGDLLPRDHDDPGAARPALGGDGLGRVRSSSRVSGSKNIRVASSMRTETRRPARPAVDRCERSDLMRAPAMVRWMTSVPA